MKDNPKRTIIIIVSIVLLIYFVMWIYGRKENFGGMFNNIPVYTHGTGTYGVYAETGTHEPSNKRMVRTDVPNRFKPSKVTHKKNNGQLLRKKGF